MNEKPNILFFFTDDQRFDTISSWGHPTVKTPNIDAIVQDGVSFTQAHIPSGTSGAICMPSRAMLHTGRTLFHLEREGQGIDEGHVMLGETLQAAGYRTFGTGKWHNGPRAYARSFTDGAEIFFGGMQDHWNVPAHSFDPTGKYETRSLKVNNCMLDNGESEFISDHVTGGKHSSELFCDAAVDFIDNYQSEDPFFTYISFMAPHDPRSMPKRFREMYKPEDMELPKNFMSLHPVEYGNTTCRDEVLAGYPRTPGEVKRHIAEYYAMISHLDHEIGKVLQALKKKGVYDNTIIVFAADNGLAVGQHGLMGKQNHFEHSIRVPFVIAGPGIPKGETREAYIYLLDIFPTLCDLTGLDIPATVDGISFKSIIDNANQVTREHLYFAYIDKIRSVKNDRYKLMEFMFEGNRTTLLFDVNDDPLELANLAGRSDSTPVIEDLRKKMAEFRDEWDEEKHPFGLSYWGDYRKSLF